MLNYQEKERVAMKRNVLQQFLCLLIMMIPLYLLFFVGCSCKVAPQIVIEEQPTDYVADIGEWANFNIACTDQKLRYVWQQGT